MIVDLLENAARYAGLKDGLSEAFGFLNHPGLNALPPGRYEISGDRVYAVISEETGRSVEEGRLEAHRRHIDIQYVISGNESMGWSPCAGLKPAGEYDAENDVRFFEGRPESVVRVPEGAFVVFLPTDAHLPLIGEGPIRKAVVKVRVGD